MLELNEADKRRRPIKTSTAKPKDLVGIPWMVSFALRADGWYLRQDIIWAKPNPMPESVTDRCTKSHEYIFLLSKSAKYYYDADAIAEPSIDRESYEGRKLRGPKTIFLNNGYAPGMNAQTLDRGGSGLAGKTYPTRNKRDVWTVATKPFAEAHFATFPEELIEPCILAGCPDNGIVLDPFMGAGTTAVVSVKSGRQYIGFDLNTEYIEIANKRISVAANNKRFDDAQIRIDTYVPETAKQMGLEDL